MDVPISELRAHLRAWVDEARSGTDVVVTERGLPVAKLVAVDSTSLLERLERDGLLSRPARLDRPRLIGRPRVRSKGSVSDLVAELRDGR